MTSTPTTLPNSRILLLNAYLGTLDGLPSNNGTPATTFKFRGETRLAIVKNLRALAPLVEELQSTRTKLRVEHLGTADPVDNEHKHPATPALNAAWTALLAATQEVPLYRIPYGDLRPEDNGIPPSVIANLAPHVVSLDD